MVFRISGWHQPKTNWINRARVGRLVIMTHNFVQHTHLNRQILIMLSANDHVVAFDKLLGHGRRSTRSKVFTTDILIYSNIVLDKKDKTQRN